jgi:hypothetical protein
MARINQQGTKELLASFDKFYMPLMELNNAVIGSICHLDEGYYEDRVKAMEGAGLSVDTISQAITIHRQQQLELAMRLGRDTMRTLTLAIEEIKPVFDSASSDQIMNAYQQLARRIHQASATLQQSNTVIGLNLTYELLADVQHELNARMKMIRANRNSDVAVLFSRQIRAAPFARQVKAVVDLCDDLSFLDENSWPKRITALRQRERERYSALSEEDQKREPNRGELQASEKYIVNILKIIPKVKKYLEMKTRSELHPAPISKARNNSL